MISKAAKNLRKHSLVRYGIILVALLSIIVVTIIVAIGVSYTITQISYIFAQIEPLESTDSIDEVPNMVMPVWFRWTCYTIFAWWFGLVVLFLFGILLSKLTLGDVSRIQTGFQFKIGRLTRIVRVIYRVVVVATCFYFYVSIPILMITIPVVVCWLAYMVYNTMVVILLAGPAFFTLVAVVRSVFVWSEEADPGYPIARDQVPDLWALVEEMAERSDARLVDAIYVAPTADISVTEDGSLIQKLRGTAQQYLVLGLGALPGMTQAQLKAILAHEYGHFIGRDTVAGNMVGHVRFIVDRMAWRLIFEKLARWYNPAWLFVNGFNRVFLRITLGASRLHEVLADRHAVMTCGVQNFADGLAHIVRQGLVFNTVVDDEIEKGRHTNLRNIYKGTALYGPLIEELEVRLDKEMNRSTSPYDSHPAPKERIEWLQRLDGSDIEDSQELVCDLLPNIEALGDMMATALATYVRQQVHYRHLRRHHTMQRRNFWASSFK